jgi:2-oxoglutarate ferredoxin oxidoreductase subunit beta
MRFDCNLKPSWCPGCGNYSILDCLKKALEDLGLNPHEVISVSGIGQAAKTPHYINTNGFNGLHGRGISPAVGMKIANKNLVVIVNSGDGDSLGEGGNHTIHNMRKNIDITHFMHNNQIYGLTKGQGSPTTAFGQITTMQLDGVISHPLNPIALSIISGATFVARSFSGDKNHLTQIMKAAILHKGYSFIDIMQPCVVFNKVNTYKWYKEHLYEIPNNHDKGNKLRAIEIALNQEIDEKIPMGIFYEVEKPTYIDLIPNIKNNVPLVDLHLKPSKADSLIEEFIY